ncbi:hypothetical protein ACHAW5_010451 [Stephanodiscus triporus]|uniref:Uncharacterized protein n=1 Tax=Stephanodiscus triporus TaxID=2934178 RepID=A0ABD3MML2_9STRA
MKSIVRAFAWHYLLLPPTTTTTTPVGAFVASALPRSRAVSLFGVTRRDEIIDPDEIRTTTASSGASVAEEGTATSGARRPTRRQRERRRRRRGRGEGKGNDDRSRADPSSCAASGRSGIPAFADFSARWDPPRSCGLRDVRQSRRVAVALEDNPNVLFDRDNYYKFGSAAPWIDPPGSTDFPRTMPFVPVQQRYDALRRYGTRISASRDVVARVGSATSADDVPEQHGRDLPAAGAGIAREFVLRDGEHRYDERAHAREVVHQRDVPPDRGLSRCALEGGSRRRLATNSYLSLLNRSISSKVGDQFGYVMIGILSDDYILGYGDVFYHCHAAGVTSGFEI